MSKNVQNNMLKHGNDVEIALFEKSPLDIMSIKRKQIAQGGIYDAQEPKKSGCAEKKAHRPSDMGADKK